MTNRTIGVALTADAAGMQAGLSAGSAAAQQFAAQTDSAFARVGVSGSRMSAATAQAEKAVDGVSRAGLAHAAAAQRFVADLERQVAAIGKTRTQLLELQAAELGVGGQAAPMIAQLRATDTVLDKTGKSAKEMAFALRGVPAQFTDIAVSLASGQRPMMVMLQQGGQLKDMFGGIGPAAKALGGYVMSMINPFTLAAGAAVGLYAAYRSGASEGEAFRKTLILSGDAAGVNAGQLQDMSARVSSVVGTQQAAAAAINEFAKSTRIGSDSFEDFASAALRWEEATGTAVSDTVKQFSELGKDPLNASVSLNESMNHLTASTYEQIRALVDQGKTSEAATVAQNAFADAINDRSPQIMENLNLWQKMWQLMKKDISEVASMIGGIGRDDSIGARIKELEASIAEREKRLSTGLGFGMGSERSQLTIDKANLDGLRQTEQTMNNITKARELDALALRKVAVADKEWAKISESNLDKKAQQEKEIEKIRQIGLAARKSEKEIEDEIAAYRAKNADKKTGGISTTVTELASLNARIEAERQRAAQLEVSAGAQAQLNEGEKLALTYSEKIKLATNGKTIAELEHNQALAGQLGALIRKNDESDKEQKLSASTIDRVSQQTRSLRDQVETYGLGKSAIEAMIIARLNERLVTEQAAGSSQAVIDGITKEIEARQELRDVMGQKEVLDAQKKYAEEWKRTNERVGDQLTDALMRGFESGKSFAENFRDTVKNMFRTLVLQPILQPIMSSVAGGIQGLLGMGQGGVSATSGGSGISSAMSLINTGKSLYSAISSGFAGISASVAGGVQSGMNFFAGTGGFVGQGPMQMSGFASGAGAAAGIAAGAGIGIMGGGLISGQYSAMGSNPNNAVYVGTAIGAAIGSIVPVIGTALGAAVGGILGGIYNRTFGMGKKEYGDTSIVGNLNAGGFSGHNETPWSQKGGLFRSNKSGTAYGVLDGEFAAQLGSAFGLVKSGVAALAMSVGVSADSLAYYSEQIKLTLTGSAEENQKLIEDTLSSVGENMIRSIIPSIADYARESETVAQTLERLSGSLAAANNALGMIRKELLEVSLAGADAAAKLGDVFGGLDKMGEVTQAFYMAVYSEGERAAHSLEGMRVALQSVGASMPRTVLELRDMALALDLTTDAGRTAYAMLLTVAPEFAAVAEATKRLAEETGAKLLESFTARGQLVAALDVTALKTMLLRDTLVSTYVAAGNISTLFLDLSSGLITFGGSAAVLDGEMTGAQAASAMLADQIAELQAGAAGATIDFAKLTAQLGSIDTNVFVATISKAFDVLAQRISSLIGDIASERIAVREAAREIIDPGAMTPDAIRRQIAGINTTLPGNSGVVAAGMKLSAADAVAEQKRRQEEAARNSYLPAQGAYQSAQSAVGPLSAALNDIQAVYDDYQRQIAQPRKYSEGRAYVRGLQAELPGIEARLNQARADLAAAQGASSGARLDEINAMAAAYASAVTESASAQAAANVAALAAKQSQTSYADALQAFAIDASKSVGKLSALREETMRYYQAQKQLADLMGSSAAGLRKTAADYRYGQLDPEDQLNKLQADYAKAYSMALSTDGDMLVGYADQMNSMLNPMLEKARDVFGSETEYNAFVATMLARAEAVAGRLDVLAPAAYEDESLALLGQIDATLAALEASSRTAEQLVVNAINAGRDATVDALRHIAGALGGQNIPAFASGGSHMGGLRLVGEYGPEIEATGPSRILNANQTRSILTGGGSGNTERLEALVAQLIEKVETLEFTARATAVNTHKIVIQGDRVEGEGVKIRTDAGEPIDVKVVA